MNRLMRDDAGAVDVVGQQQCTPLMRVEDGNFPFCGCEFRLIIFGLQYVMSLALGILIVTRYPRLLYAQQLSGRLGYMATLVSGAAVVKAGIGGDAVSIV
jgi:hypothetical protein